MRNTILLPEGTCRDDWRCLGPFHVNSGPPTGFNTKTYQVWLDKKRNVLGVCCRVSKTKSRISDISEDIARQARFRLFPEFEL